MKSRIALLTALIPLALVLSLALTANVSQAQNTVIGPVVNFLGTDGSANPIYVTPTQGRDARLYGTTSGTPNSDGTIFAVQTDGTGGVIHTFDGGHGAVPPAGVLLATDGNYYGTTFEGGSLNMGVLFGLTPNGLYTVLHDFQGGTDGSNPNAAPIEALDGNLYGTTNGNDINASTIYKYSLSSGQFTTIYQFDGTYGASVVAPLIQGTDGNLYGTAQFGGKNECGTVFKLATSGAPLFAYSFACNGKPTAPLIQASDGNFYGAALGGGAFGFGAIFKMTPRGKVTFLYNFPGKTGGASPIGGLLQATDGNFYGTTEIGGDFGNGTLFKITSSGSYGLIYSFLPHLGKSPEAALLQHTNGILYGTLQGGLHGDGSVYSVNMFLGPFVTFVQPTGRAGGSAQILGQGLTVATGVTFNGVPATSFNVESDTFMTAVVPSGATTGPVVVTTPTGRLTSNVSFRILQ